MDGTPTASKGWGVSTILRYSNSIIVETKIEASNHDLFSHSLSLDFFFHFLACCLIGDDWNLVMEH